MLKNKSLAFLYASFCILLPKTAQAATSLGIGVEEQPPVTNNSFFDYFLIKIHIWQQYFERIITDHLIAAQASSAAGLTLILFSFIYGILHAFGPGHGKAVISSYVVANNETLKRGLILSFFASILQALSAIFIILAVFFLLPIRWTDAASFTTKASFIFVLFLGLYMLYKNTKKMLKIFHKELETTTCSCHGPLIKKEILTEHFNWKAAFWAILSVGLRPCSGALLVMSFAMIHHLYYTGILAIFAMSLGTFITVSSLATLTVATKKTGEKYLGRKKGRKNIPIILEFAFSLILFIIGGSLTIAAFL